MKKLFSLLTLALLTMSAWAATSTLTFEAACGGSGTASDGAIWTVTSDAAESVYDSTKGIHYGTSKVAVSYLTLTTDDIPGTITKITVNASGASQQTPALNVTVGGAAFGSEVTLSGTAAEYTLEGSASGEINVTISQTSNTKALYCKSISVEYETSTPVTTVAAPVFNPADGYHFSGTLTATVSCETENASIYLYKVVDGEIDYSTMQYFFQSGTFYVTETATYAAQATKGDEDSEFTYVTYTLDDNPDPIVTDYITFNHADDAVTSRGEYTVTRNGASFTVSDGLVGTESYRIYQHATITFTSTAGNITKIEFDGLNGTNPVSGFGENDGLTFDGNNGTWTGEDETVTLTVNDKQVRATEIRVYVDGEITQTVSAPTFNPASGATFYTSLDVTMTGPEGSNIVYMLNNGDEITAASPVTVTLNETTTILAYAELDGVESDLVEATYTKVDAPGAVNTLAAANALADSTAFTFTGAAVVTYHNGRYLFVRDASGYGLIYYNAAPATNFANGVVLNQNWTATKVTYRTLVEYSDPANVTASEATNPELAAEQEIEASQMANMINAYVKINHVKSISGTTATLVDGTTVALYNRFNVTIPEFTDQDCSITGIVSIYNGNLQLYFIESDYDPSIVPVEGTTFELVTSVADLNDGDQIILVNNESAKAMGAARDNNFGAVAVQINENTIVTNEANVLTLEAQGNNWAFKTSDDLYLYAAGSDKNWLKTEAELDSNAIAAITIDGEASIVFQGNNTRNIVRYNKTSDLFSCYASGQQPVHIYKATTPVVTVAAPVFNPANNTTFTDELTVTLTCETEGADIYYGFDNVNWTKYTAPFTIDSTCTVYAYAQLGDAKSAPVTAKYYKAQEVGTIAEANALDENTNFAFTGEAIVTYQWKNPKNDYISTWIKDASGYGLIYGKQVPELTTGDVLADGWDAKKTVYNSIPEFQYPNNVAASGDQVTVEPEEKTTLTTDDVNMYVIMKAQTLTLDASDTTNCTWLNEAELKFYNQFFKTEGLNIESGKTYDVVGIATIYKNAPEFYIISVTEAAAETWMKGDVNHDHEIDVADVALLIKAALGQEIDTDFYATEADLDNDPNSIDVGDVSVLINMVLGKVE